MKKIINQIYVNNTLIDFEVAELFIDGEVVKNLSKFRIKNRFDLSDQIMDDISYVLEVMQEPIEETTSTRGGINGLQIKEPKRKAVSTRGGGLNGLQIKEPKKNISSVHVNRRDNKILFYADFKINGKIINDETKVELFVDGEQLENFAIVFNTKNKSLVAKREK